MKTISNFAVLFALTFFLSFQAHSQQTGNEFTGQNPNTRDTVRVSFKSETVINSQMIESYNKSSHATADISFSDVIEGGIDEISIRYMAYKRVRLSFEEDSIQSVFIAEVNNIKSEIKQNKIDYSNLICNEDAPKKLSEQDLKMQASNAHVVKEGSENTVLGN